MSETKRFTVRKDNRRFTVRATSREAAIQKIERRLAGVLPEPSQIRITRRARYANRPRITCVVCQQTDAIASVYRPTLCVGCDERFEQIDLETASVDGIHGDMVKSGVAIIRKRNNELPSGFNFVEEAL
jgi:hypothetical protein